MTARSRRYGIVTLAVGSFEAIAQLWRTAEALGFDQAWVDDDLLVPDALEPWTLLAALARETSRMRIGTLVTQIPFRHPTLLAAEAITVDRIAGGRLEVGIGAGDPNPRIPIGAVGHDPWSPQERAARFGEQVELLDRLLRGERVDHAGRFYRAQAVQLPPPVQRPRPPLVIAAQASSSLRLAARFADGWNTLGGQSQSSSGLPRLPLDAAVARTRQAVQQLEGYCSEIGRDPTTVRRSVLALRAEPVPLSSLDAFDEFVGRYAEVSIEEFIFYWPPIANVLSGEPISAAQQATFEQIAGERVAKRS
jgi:alkanesulfonate monooxygenase SsuD/methylene tetrahydromethanopterin reductase-like flavin-dependent oxidoreductase (luciferase family)